MGWIDPSGSAAESTTDAERAVRRAITEARRQGFGEAADNLERYMNGVGGMKQVSSSWLRKFPAVTKAEEKNKTEFRMGIAKQCAKMSNGGSMEFQDYWDAYVLPHLRDKLEQKLYYASGVSTLRSRGNFTIAKENDCCTVNGTVEHHWYDFYNWDKGGAVMPDGTVIRDSDMDRFRKEGKAKNFGMESYWHQTLDAKSTPAEEEGMTWVWEWGDIVDGQSGMEFREPPFGKNAVPHLKELGLDRHGQPLKEDDAAQ
jgi:hypothetical protein